MHNTKRYSISIIGAGNVGYHLAHILHKKGFVINYIYSRNKARFCAYSADFKSSIFSTNLSKIPHNSSLYIIAVSDDAIASIARQLPKVTGIVTHTSGAMPVTLLQMHTHYGIFYPLQSFSRHKTIDFTHIPFCISANTPQKTQLLQQIAQQISQVVHCINDQQRAALHVAAVFVNNFTNHLLHIGQHVSQHHNVPFNILRPLIKETFLKALSHEPKQAQTGPARRGDVTTIQKHLQLLESLPNYQNIYALLSNSIQQHYADGVEIKHTDDVNV